MKIVRDHINEAFSETGDPIKDMGLGANFSNLTQAANFLVHILPEITGEEDLEKYLDLTEGGGFIAAYLWGPIWDYAVEYFSIDGIDMRRWGLNHFSFDYNLCRSLREVITNEIIKIKKRKSRTNEAFSEKGDPIKDMGIGNLQSFWKKAYEQIGNTHPTPTYEKYFPKNLDIDETAKHKCVYILYDMLGYVSQGFLSKYSETDLLSRACLDNFVDKNHYSNDFKNNYYKKEIRKAVIKVLKERFSIYVIKKRINEKFNEKSDPIRDMGIGVDELVKQFKKELEEEFIILDPIFNYYPHHKFIRIRCGLLSQKGLKDLHNAINKVLPKYSDILYLKRFPTFKYARIKTSDVLIYIK